MVARAITCTCAIVIGLLAASSGGRFSGGGIGFDIAVVLGVVAFAAPVWAQWADDRDRAELEHLKKEAMRDVLRRGNGLDSLTG